MMPITVARRIGQQPHTAQRRREVHQPEGERRDQPDRQQIAEAVALDRGTQPDDQPAAARGNRIGKVMTNRQEQCDGAERGASDRQCAAEPCAEQQPARHRDDGGLRQRERGNHDVDRDIQGGRDRSRAR